MTGNGAKKRIIRRMAWLGAAVFAVGTAMTAVGFVADFKQQRRFERDRQRERQKLVDRGRGMLAEFAQDIQSLPVDPAVTGEIESRFYDEQPSMRMYVWALDTQGEFLFGVPAEAFVRLNDIYDANREQIRAEGRFANRQEFLRELVQLNRDLPSAAPGTRRPPDAFGEVVRHHPSGEAATVLSTPIRAQEGVVLGNLYMKIVPAKAWHFLAPGFEAVAAVGGTLMVVAGALLWFLLPSWVYVDATARGLRRAGLWSFLVLISFVLGLVVYLIARPEHLAALECPGCGREINGGDFCPYCGRDVSAAFCAACRYPLKPDWTFCPSCRAEITRTQTPAAEDEESPTA